MPKQHPDFEAAIEVGQELAALKREARERGKEVVPFGQERVSPATLRKRLMESKELRRTLLGKPGGREAILALFREEK